MAYVVSAKVSRGGKRIDSRKFKQKHKAIDFLENTRKMRPGSNPRLKQVK
jgi:hypothetical protein